VARGAAGIGFFLLGLAFGLPRRRTTGSQLDGRLLRSLQRPAHHRPTTSKKAALAGSRVDTPVVVIYRRVPVRLAVVVSAAWAASRPDHRAAWARPVELMAVADTIRGPRPRFRPS